MYYLYIYTQMNHQVSNIEIKVVKGTILPEENELGSEYSLFYWANFVPHYDGKMIFIIGELLNLFSGFGIKSLIGIFF